MPNFRSAALVLEETRIIASYNYDSVRISLPSNSYFSKPRRNGGPQTSLTFSRTWITGLAFAEERQWDTYHITVSIKSLDAGKELPVVP